MMAQAQSWHLDWEFMKSYDELLDWEMLWSDGTDPLARQGIFNVMRELRAAAVTVWVKIRVRVRGGLGDA